jgi:soluble lytic murein transglycosylase-like protein
VVCQRRFAAVDLILHAPPDSGILPQMSVRPALISGTLRLVAVGLCAAAVVILLRQGQAERLNAPLPETAVAAADTVAVLPGPRDWSLRTNGWYIRVDGAEIALPSFAEMTAARPHASLAVSISPFDRLIVHHAKAEGFDWRLVAALIFEESRFNPDSRSDKGAVGLMQVRPIAAEAVGASRFKAPDDNVKTGVRYLRQLDGMFQEARGRDRLSLVLAAYNMGPGHVRDAQGLARRFGYDPNRWDDAMELMLPLLEQPQIYKQLPNGFAKGHDTVGYVQRTLERYRRYQRETGVSLDADALSSSDPVNANG